jgi:hypothetical protein
MLAPHLRCRLAPTTRADIHARSRGRITRNPIAWDFAFRRDGTLAAERGGFHDEALFGPLAEPGDDRFAHLDLPEPVPHPFLRGEQITTLAVLPAAFRPFTRNAQSVVVDEITFLYARLYQTLHRWARLRELNAPATIVSEHRETLIVDIAVLFDNDFAPSPLVTTTGTRPASLARLLETTDLRRLDAVLFALGLRLTAVA